MLRDEQLYPDPSKFDPERFMEKVDEETRRRRDPRSCIFGFGRRYVFFWCFLLLLNHCLFLFKIPVIRICPGSHLVESSIWLLIVCMIATLDISKAKDEHGREIDPNPKFDNEVVRYIASTYCIFS
jgi:cytochrome P450